ncbi:uncharacterized protein LOC144449873 [Glandiceps talaboti]
MELALDTDRSPEVTLDTDRLEAKLNRSDFAQVVFQNVAETYPPGAHIECHYTLTIAIQPTSRDWVGLYKVGWTSVKDYQTFNYVSIPARVDDNDIEATVLFSAYYLPKEDGEFYQFVYVNKNGEVKGASTPFQFKTPTADDFIEIEDENTDMLLIKTKTAFCEERLNQANEEKAKLVRQLRRFEDTQDNLTQKITELHKQLDEEKKNYTQLEGWYKKALSTSSAIESDKHGLQLKVTHTEDEIKKLTEDIEKKEKALAEVVKKSETCEGNLEELTKVKEDLERQLEDSKNEIEMYKEQFTAADIENKTLLEQVAALKSQLSDTDQSLMKTKEETNQLQSRIDEERRKFERQLHVTSADKAHMSTLESKVKNYEDKLAALEETKTLLTEELDTLKQVQYNMSKTMEEKTDEAGNLKTQLQRQKLAYQEREGELKEEIKALRDGLTQLAEEKEKLIKEIHKKEKEHEGPLYALQEVNKHLKDRYDKLKKLHEELVKQRDDLVKKHVTVEQDRSDLQRENDDLRERLEMGAAAWTEKYKECKKLEGKVKKLRKSTSVTESSKDSLEDSLGKTEEQVQESADVNSFEGVKSTQAIAFDSVLHTQLNELEKELEDRNSKCVNYKQLLQKEKAKCDDVEDKYRQNMVAVKEELDEKREECVKLEQELQDERARSQDKEKCLEEEISLLRVELEKEKCEREQKDEAYFELLKQIESSNTSLRMLSCRGLNNNTEPADGTGNGSMFVNPYEEDARRLRQQYSNEGPLVRGPPLLPPPPMRPPVIPRGWPMRPPPPPPPHCFGLPPPPPPHMRGQLPPPLIPQVVPNTTTPTTTNRVPADQPDSTDILTEVLNDTSLIAGMTCAGSHGNTETRIDVENQAAEPLTSVDETVTEDRDETGQEFHDAPEYPDQNEGVPRWCPECRLLFPPSCPQDTFDEHVQSHYGRLCPMCGIKFPKSESSQDDFERHVQHHFEQDN